jgi:hypothetical protein
MRHVRLALLLAAVGGCSSTTDPCSSEKGACITATVEGSAHGLDQLLFAIDKPMPKSVFTPSVPAAFSLPVKVALVLPAGVTGSVSVTVDGLAAGAAIAHTQQTVSVPASGHGAATFRLDSGTAPMDLAVAADLATGPDDGGGSDGPVDMIKPPITVTTMGPTMVSELDPIKLDITANDPLGAALTLSVTNLPTGATVSTNGATATVSWTPGIDQAGMYTIMANVSAADTARNVSKPIMLTIKNGADPLFRMSPNDATMEVPGTPIGDFDGDGFGDIAACSLVTTGTPHYEVAILYGDASGLPTAMPPYPMSRLHVFTFPDGAASSTAGTRRLFSCAGGDIDGDGFSDVIIGDSGANSTGGYGMVYVMFGQTARTGMTVGRPTLLAIDTATLRMNEQIGRFPFVVGDFNGDNVADFATATQVTVAGSPTNYYDSVYVWLGKKSANPDPPKVDLVTSTSNAPGFCGFRQLNSAGDVDKDMQAELLVYDQHTDSANCPNTTSEGVTLIRSFRTPIQINKSFLHPATGSTTTFGNFSALCDVDNDGSADLIVLDGGKIEAFFAGGADVFPVVPATTTLDLTASATTVVMPRAGGGYKAGIRCVNGFDGAGPTLVVNDVMSTPPKVDVFGGGRMLTISRSIINPDPSDATFGKTMGGHNDINGDGKQDLVVGSNTTGKYWIIYGR